MPSAERHWMMYYFNLLQNDIIGKGILAFATRLFECVPEQDILPFFTVLLVYIGSAMTHINERIRLRGIRFLHILTLKYPQLITNLAQNVHLTAYL